MGNLMQKRLFIPLNHTFTIQNNSIHEMLKLSIKGQ